MLILKKASPIDAPLLYLIRYEAYLPQYGTYSMPDDPCTQTETEFIEKIRQGNTFCMVLGDRIIGGLEMDVQEDYVALKEIYVLSAFRRMGAAQKALLHGEVLLPSAKYRAQVIAGETASYALLTRMGFRGLPEYTPKSDRVTLLNLEKDASSLVSVTLEPLTREQLSHAVNWCNEDETRQLYCPLWQSSREKVLTMTEFSKNFSFGKHYIGAAQLCFAVKAVEFDKLVGIVSLTAPDWEQHTAQVEYFLLDPKWRNASLGKRILQRLCSLAREQYGLEQLRLTVLEENKPAIACFLKSGFTESSRKQNVMRGGDDQVRTRILMTCDIREAEHGSDT